MTLNMSSTTQGQPSNYEMHVIASPTGGNLETFSSDLANLLRDQ
ncbi:MAG: hypothetical protein ACYC9J_15430 [Sulfuricaulis sp.]